MRVAVRVSVTSILPKKHWALAWLLLLLTGCDARTNIEPSGVALRQNIVRGVPTSEHPAVVQLHMYLKDGPRMHCSGSLVARDRVLTAAHCVPEYFWIDNVPKKLEKVNVYFGSDASQPGGAGDLHEVREATHWERNPDALLRDKLPEGDAGADTETEPEMEPDAGPPRPAFGAEAYVGRYDTAIVYLAEPAPEAVQALPVTYDLPSQEQLRKLPAQIVGFGAIGVNDDGSLIEPGIKRQGNPRVLGVTEISDDLDRYTNTVEIVAADGVIAAGCKEDSGGPLFLQLDNTWTIIAVTSWGDPQCYGNVHYATLTESEPFLRNRIPREP
jgi:hypothetical protein